MAKRSQREFLGQLRDTLADHATYVFTDNERNMIRCVCGWESVPFLPEGLQDPREIFATHQVTILLDAGLV